MDEMTFYQLDLVEGTVVDREGEIVCRFYANDGIELGAILMDDEHYHITAEEYGQLLLHFLEQKARKKFMEIRANGGGA